MTRRTRQRPEDEKFSSEEKEPEDIYNEETREEMVEDDEITASEEGFMRGWEGSVEGGKRNKRTNIHRDTPSVETVKEQYRED